MNGYEIAAYVFLGAVLGFMFWHVVNFIAN